VDRGEHLALALMLVEHAVGARRPVRQVLAQQRHQHGLLERQVHLDRRMQVAHRVRDRFGRSVAAEPRVRDRARFFEQPPNPFVLPEDAAPSCGGVQTLGGRSPSEIDRGHGASLSP